MTIKMPEQIFFFKKWYFEHIQPHNYSSHGVQFLYCKKKRSDSDSHSNLLVNSALEKTPERTNLWLVWEVSRSSALVTSGELGNEPGLSPVLSKIRLSSLPHFVSFFLFRHTAILVPWPGSKPVSPAVTYGVLTTGPPGNSLKDENL